MNLYAEIFPFEKLVKYNWKALRFCSFCVEQAE